MYTATGYYGSTKPKIYGVEFDAWAKGIREGATSRPSTKGIRLYDAAGYKFIRGTATTATIDSFFTYNAAPFAVKECVTNFDSNGYINVVAYKSASNWNSVKDNTSYNRMIEFPLFFYSRPTPYEFRVTSEFMNGYLPSPMHYQNGSLYEKVYISKYLLDGSGMSRRNQAAYNISSSESQFASNKLYRFDSKAYFSLLILMLIKYANLNIPSVIGKGLGTAAGDTYTTGGCETVQGYDGGMGLVGENASIITFGIEDLYGTALNKISGYPSNGVNGTIVYKPSYFNTTATTKTFQLLDSDGNNASNNSSTNVYDLMYSPEYPFLLSPSNTGTYSIETTTGPLGQMLNSVNSTHTRSFGYQFGAATVDLESYKDD